jgi:hypothetical protein
LYSRVDSFPEPRTFFVSLFLRVIFSLSPNGAREREEERERERERFTRVLGPSLEGDFVISYERKSARARVLSHSGSFLGE